MSEPPKELTTKRAKIVDYLLNIDHVEGGSKAKFFIAHGFSPERPQEFIQELFWHANDETFVRSVDSVWGVKFIFEGTLVTPDARNPHIRSVWLQRPGSRLPELLTAYPL